MHARATEEDRTIVAVEAALTPLVAARLRGAEELCSQPAAPSPAVEHAQLVPNAGAHGAWLALIAGAELRYEVADRVARAPRLPGRRGASALTLILILWGAQGA
ncbi:Hypothetical protein A7982_04550 [Minicystis rosea]|nr:Hypothetical protein A7982_04550 [Minicystis rosea]